MYASALPLHHPCAFERQQPLKLEQKNCCLRVTEKICRYLYNSDRSKQLDVSLDKERREEIGIVEKERHSSVFCRTRGGSNACTHVNITEMKSVNLHLNKDGT